MSDAPTKISDARPLTRRQMHAVLFACMSDKTVMTIRRSSFLSIFRPTDEFPCCYRRMHLATMRDIHQSAIVSDRNLMLYGRNYIHVQSSDNEISTLLSIINLNSEIFLHPSAEWVDNSPLFNTSSLTHSMIKEKNDASKQMSSANWPHIHSSEDQSTTQHH